MASIKSTKSVQRTTKCSASAKSSSTKSCHKISDNNSNYNSIIPETKWIQVYINGDEHFPGYRCVVNAKYYRTFDVFLRHLTERLQPSFGAVRNIYTPINGHTVNRLEDLMPNEKYVVAGSERLKKLEPGYSEIGEKQVKRTGVKSKTLDNKYKTPKAKPLFRHGINQVVNFYKNGYFKTRPYRIAFHNQDLENWDTVFRKITDVLKCGPIKRLCLLDGKPLKSVQEIESSEQLVIIGKNEVYKNGPYGSLRAKKHSSTSETSLDYEHFMKSTVINGRTSVLLSKSSAHSNNLTDDDSSYDYNTSDKVSLYSARRSKWTNDLNKSETVSNYETEMTHDVADTNDVKISINDDSDSVSHHENEINDLSENNPVDNYSDGANSLKQKFGEYARNKTDMMSIIKEVDLDDDLSGIYRAKTQNHLTVGAVEIDEDNETAVDMPVDLLDAEEVEDEITPDMERSLQHLKLDVPDEIVAFLPTVQRKQTGNRQTVSENKYRNISHSQSFDVQNVFV